MQKKEVMVSLPVYRKIKRLLSENQEIEVVGLGFGAHKNNQIRMTNFVTMTNLDNSAISFSLDYEVLYREIQHHEEKGKNLVGIFHSHPEGAQLYPSQKDYHFMRYWPYPYLWLIGGGGGEGSDPKLVIFSLLNGEIIEIPYLITSD